MGFPTMWYCDQQRLRSECAYAQSDQSLCSSLEYSMSVKLLTEHLLEVLSLKRGCTGSSESRLVKLLEISCHGSYIHGCQVCSCLLFTRGVQYVMKTHSYFLCHMPNERSKHRLYNGARNIILSFQI